MTNRTYSYSRLQNYASDGPSPSSRNGSRKNRLRNQSKQGTIDSSSDEELPRYTPMTLRKIKPGISVHSTADLHRDIVDHSIQPGETLQGIALQYRCSVFDVKRANGIVNDTEFFAFRTLKIPVILHSSLKESPLSPPSKDSGKGRSETRNKSLEPPNFLQQVDEDLQKLKERAKTYEIQAAQQEENFENIVTHQHSKRLDCRGDDCGLSWSQVVGLAFLVLLACPLLYFLHLELEKHGKSSVNASSTTTDETFKS